MFVRVQPQQYRYQGVATGRWHRASSASESGAMSAALKRVVIIVLGTALVLVFVVSQLFYWKIMESERLITDLRTTVSLSSLEHDVLVTTRDQLLTPQRIKAVAAVKFDLHVPGENQVHRF